MTLGPCGLGPSRIGLIELGCEFWLYHLAPPNMLPEIGMGNNVWECLVQPLAINVIPVASVQLSY